MPNWCDNYIVLEHKNKRKAKEFAKKCQAESENNDNAFFYKIARERAFVIHCEYDGANTLKLCVDSAWSPCTETIVELERKGFELVKGSYYEGGAGICGYLLGDEFDANDFENIQADIIETHGIEQAEEENE